MSTQGHANPVEYIQKREKKSLTVSPFHLHNFISTNHPLYFHLALHTHTHTHTFSSSFLDWSLPVYSLAPPPHLFLTTCTTSCIFLRLFVSRVTWTSGEVQVDTNGREIGRGDGRVVGWRWGGGRGKLAWENCESKNKFHLTVWAIIWQSTFVYNLATWTGRVLTIRNAPQLRMGNVV